ncbi:MAG: hypothetical protein QM687_04405 [Ferruginibacter sp.]
MKKLVSVVNDQQSKRISCRLIGSISCDGKIYIGTAIVMLYNKPDDNIADG